MYVRMYVCMKKSLLLRVLQISSLIPPLPPPPGSCPPQAFTALFRVDIGWQWP